MIVERTDGAFMGRHNGETLLIEAWGPDALRVRTTREATFAGQDWALVERPSAAAVVKECEQPCVGEDHRAWRIENGRVSCTVNAFGVLTFFRDGRLILREHFRNYDGTISRESHCLKMEGRTYRAHVGGAWRIVQRFEANPGEQIGRAHV